MFKKLLMKLNPKKKMINPYFRSGMLFDRISSEKLNEKIDLRFLELLEKLIEKARKSESEEKKESKKSWIIPLYLDQLIILFESENGKIEEKIIDKPLDINDLNKIKLDYSKYKFAYAFSFQSLYQLARGELKELVRKKHLEIGDIDEKFINSEEFRVSTPISLVIISNLKSNETIAFCLSPAFHMIGLAYPNPDERCLYIAHFRHALKSIFSHTIRSKPDFRIIIAPHDAFSEISTGFWVYYGLLSKKITKEISESEIEEKYKISVADFLLFGSHKMYEKEGKTVTHPDIESAAQNKYLGTGVGLGFLDKDKKIRMEYRFEPDNVNGAHIDYAIYENDKKKLKIVNHILHHFQIDINEFNEIGLKDMYANYKKVHPKITSFLPEK